VTGVLEPPSGGGEAAITMAIFDGSKQKGSVRLTVPATATAATDIDAYLRLAPACAVWLQYEGAALLRGVDPVPDEAVSYARVREGFDRQLAGDVDGAKTAYEQALSENDRNWAARVNLALAAARLVGARSSPRSWTGIGPRTSPGRTRRRLHRSDSGIGRRHPVA
jgi:hypothetical protein